MKQKGKIMTKKLTKEQKVRAINEYYENYRNEIEEELRDYLNKQYIGTALEIGSSIIPIGGAGKIGGQVGKQIFKNKFGRKIAENIGTGAISGAISGGIYGIGNSFIDQVNPILSTLNSTISGGAAGGTLGAIGSNIQKLIKGQQLKNYGNIDILDKTLRKQYNDKSRKFYQDYIQEIQLDKNGNINFTKRGIQEQLRWNPQQTQNLPELVEDIKNAQRLPDVPNTKPLEKPYVSHYEVYRGKNGDHYIEVMQDGNKRFYITKDAYTGTPHATSTGSNVDIETSFESPNSILPIILPDYNPLTGNYDLLYGKIDKNDKTNNPTGFAAPIGDTGFLNDVLKDIEQNNKQNQQKQEIKKFVNPVTGDSKIFTREKLSKMNSKDFTKNEQAIFAQLNTLGIPSQSEVNRAIYNSTSQDADGHWVTINGHHVLIKD